MLDNNDVLGGWDDPAMKDYNPKETTEIEEIEEVDEESENEGYYDNRSIVKAAGKLIDEYPKLEDDIDRLIDVANTTGWSLAKVCRAEYDDSTKEKESLSSEDEKAFKYYKSKNPGCTREQYIRNVLNCEQKIPHDRWE